MGGEGSLNERDLSTITELQRRGVVVSIATGRMYSGTRAVAHRIGVTGPVACIDGSHIVDAVTDEELLCHAIAPTALGRVAAVFREAAATTVAFSRDVIWYDSSSAPYLPFLTVWSDRKEQIDDVLGDPRWQNGEAVTALVAVAEAERLAKARDRLLVELDGAVQANLFMVDRDGNAGMVLRAEGATKGTALEWIARYHGVEPAEVVAVGDWVNDIPMFRAAGRSFCMAQSPADVVAAATDRLDADGWSGGGIAEAAARAGML